MSDTIAPLTADERADIRGLHVTERSGDCRFCSMAPPCDVVRLLAAVDAAEQTSTAIGMAYQALWPALREAWQQRDAALARAEQAETAPACGQTYADPRCEAMTRAMREAAEHPLDGGCGKPLAWRVAYRCLECGRWMHATCLRQHFEETCDGACPAEHQRDAALARVDALTAAGRSFVAHHDNGQTGQPGFPRTYGELEVWQAEWDRRYDALRAALAAGPAPDGEE